MKTKHLVALATCASVVLAVAPSTVAQHIFLSGDINIGNPLDGSFSAPLDAGNRRFFQNILQGGTNVVVHGDTDVGGSGALVPPAINNFYNSLAGVTSSIYSGVISNATLTGTDLFVVIMPNNAYTAGEIASMQNLLHSGGNLLFLGDNAFFPNENARINSVLSALGSNLSILPTDFDTGFQTATGSQIAVDPFTTGVSTFTYALASQVAVTGGKALFFGTGGQPFLAYALVPEPVTLLPIVIALAALATSNRRRCVR